MKPTLVALLVLEHQTRMHNLIAGADTSLDVQMYLFTVDSLADDIVAAKNRGVAVRVLLDPDHDGNPDVRAQLTSAGVPNQNAPSGFANAHAKYLIVDGAAVAIMSANFNIGAMSSERNYGVIDRDPDDIADVQAIFDADWAGTTPDLACTRLVVSPVNAKSRILALINSATATLDVEVIYLSESTVRAAITSAKNRGVAIRVIVADPADFPENQTAIETLQNTGVPVRVANFSLHAKLIITDGAALVGSENMSMTSFTQNREVGVLIQDAASLATIRAQVDTDWGNSTVP